MQKRVNVTDRLGEVAQKLGDVTAIACPWHSSHGHRSARRIDAGRRYITISFAELESEVAQLARGFVQLGVQPGTRIALLVRPGIDFVALVLALLRSGAVTVLVDSGMGRPNLLRCLQQVEPDGFVAVYLAQWLRSVLHHRFPRARLNVTIGSRCLFGGLSLDRLRELGGSDATPLPVTHAADPAAVIFTSGSTGPPKGVLYTHGMFDTQVAEIQSHYRIQPGVADLACFPLFGLFNSAMGVTTVLPDMDFSRPAAADPQKLLAAAQDWHVTQSFASPTVWDKVSRHCAQHGVRIDTLQAVFSCGAPVPAALLRRTLACVAPHAQMHTPYGATECLPVSTVEAAEVLGETSARTNEGAGICVGSRFSTIDWKIVRISDDPITTLDYAEQLPLDEIGELIVRGPQASPGYVTHAEANPASKIRDGDSFWHRMGDVGYLDEYQRFWYCGRKSHRVELGDGTLFTIPVEAIFNQIPEVRRSALIGIGPRGNQTPAIVVESHNGRGNHICEEVRRFAQSHKLTQRIQRFLIHTDLPVDVRHNAKIDREELSKWAEKRIVNDNR